jgi:hypothetical protein
VVALRLHEWSPFCESIVELEPELFAVGDDVEWVGAKCGFFCIIGVRHIVIVAGVEITAKLSDLLFLASGRFVVKGNASHCYFLDLARFASRAAAMRAAAMDSLTERYDTPLMRGRDIELPMWA